MAFSYEQDGSLNELQSDLDDFIDLNQFDEGYMNVSEGISFPIAIDEEYMTNDWSVNQNPDPEEYPAYASLSGEAYSEGNIHDQLSTSELQTAIPPSEDPSYSSGFVQALCRSVRQVNEAFLDNAVMHFNTQQPPFSSAIDDSVCASEATKDYEQETEQARHQQFLKDEDVPSNYQLHPHELELIEPEEIQRITGSAFNVEDHSNNIFGSSHHDLLGEHEEEAPMFADDHDGKDFSSWLLYGSDDNIAAFKDVLSESTSGHRPQFTVSTHTKNSSNAKPIANLHDGSHGKGSKEHTVPGSGSQANKASLNEKPKSDIANDSGKEAVHRSSTKLLSNLNPKQCNSSHDQPPRQSPVFDNSDLSEAGSSFHDAIVRTSTPNNSARHTVIVDDQTVTRDVTPIKEINEIEIFSP